MNGGEPAEEKDTRGSELMRDLAVVDSMKDEKVVGAGNGESEEKADRDEVSTLDNGVMRDLTAFKTDEVGGGESETKDLKVEDKKMGDEVFALKAIEKDESERMRDFTVTTTGDDEVIKAGAGGGEMIRDQTEEKREVDGDEVPSLEAIIMNDNSTVSKTVINEEKEKEEMMVEKIEKTCKDEKADQQEGKREPGFPKTSHKFYSAFKETRQNEAKKELQLSELRIKEKETLGSITKRREVTEDGDKEEDKRTIEKTGGEAIMKDGDQDVKQNDPKIAKGKRKWNLFEKKGNKGIIKEAKGKEENNHEKTPQSQPLLGEAMKRDEDKKNEESEEKIANKDAIEETKGEEGSSNNEKSNLQFNGEAMKKDEDQDMKENDKSKAKTAKKKWKLFEKKSKKEETKEEEGGSGHQSLPLNVEVMKSDGDQDMKQNKENTAKGLVEKKEETKKEEGSSGEKLSLQSPILNGEAMKRDGDQNMKQNEENTQKEDAHQLLRPNDVGEVKKQPSDQSTATDSKQLSSKKLSKQQAGDRPLEEEEVGGSLKRFVNRWTAALIREYFNDYYYGDISDNRSNVKSE